jgi:hypothetical protein
MARREVVELIRTLVPGAGGLTAAMHQLRLIGVGAGDIADAAAEYRSGESRRIREFLV